jgi:uncharacterized OB-fold protein
MSEITKPLPLLAGLSGEFYAWCKKKELRFQVCGSCKTWRHVPREMCAECGSFEWSWEQSKGQGSLFTWTVAGVPLHPAFKADLPYASCVIQLDEGVRMVSQIIDCKPEELVMDQRVEVVFEAVSDEVTLPKFRRA